MAAGVKDVAPGGAPLPQQSAALARLAGRSSGRAVAQAEAEACRSLVRSERVDSPVLYAAGHGSVRSRYSAIQWQGLTSGSVTHPRRFPCFSEQSVQPWTEAQEEAASATPVRARWRTM